MAAVEFKVCPKTVAKWVRRYQAWGAAGPREWAYAKHRGNSDRRDAALRP